MRAMTKWPDVPAVYGWLHLDRRGQWRLRGETIANSAANRFISRNYACDDRGCWYFQNGPQRVFVSLEYTPWVYHLDNRGVLFTHTEIEARYPEAVWLDERGDFIVLSEHGIGLLDDRDLAPAAARIRDAEGKEISDDVLETRLERLLAHPAQEVVSLRWQYGNSLVPICTLNSEEFPTRFSYVPDPEEQ